MDDLDEITQIALFESRTLLEESERLISKGVSKAGTVAELFQRIHTVKSNMAAIPGSKSISLLLQNLETILSNLRNQKREIDEKHVDLFLKPIELALSLLEILSQGKADASLEKEIFHCVSALRLKLPK